MSSKELRSYKWWDLFQKTVRVTDLEYSVDFSSTHDIQITRLLSTPETARIIHDPDYPKTLYFLDAVNLATIYRIQIHPKCISFKHANSPSHDFRVYKKRALIWNYYLFDSTLSKHKLEIKKNNIIGKSANYLKSDDEGLVFLNRELGHIDYERVMLAFVMIDFIRHYY
jgi:hypothetical protein